MPEFFVARDRARRIGWNLEKVLQERRLAWRGDEIGMASLQEKADLTLAGIAQDARTSTAAVLAGDLRDRERGFLEIPFVVALTTVASLVERAAALEAGRLMGRVAPAEAKRGMEPALQTALERLEAFQAAYDEKTPLLEPRAIDLAHLLHRVGPSEGRPWDRPPPPMVTEPFALADLLLAVRVALGDEDGAWQVTLPRAGRPLTLGLGDRAATPGGVPVPPDVQRAADVLSFRQRVEVETHARAGALGGARLAGLTVRLSDPAGETLATAVAVASGGEARLSPAAERAAHALMAAPPAPEDGSIPPVRLVALAGLLQVLDQEVQGRIAGRFVGPEIRIAAADLPREPTRKAPLKRAFAEGLQAALPDLPVGRLADLVEKVAAGRLTARQVSTADAALLLAVFGRSVSIGGVRLEARLRLAPWTEGEVLDLVHDLQDVVRVRRLLDAGQEVPPEELARLECAAVAALGRLGRLTPGA